MDWALRYTSHLGYEPPELRMQFRETLGTEDVARHIQFAAQIGMAGVLYPWAISRPAAEVDAVRRELVATGLQASTIVSTPFEMLVTPIWPDRSAASRARLEEQIRCSCKMASFLNSSMLAVLITEASDIEAKKQIESVAANLKEMASIVGDHGLSLAIEPMVLLPNMLLKSTKAGIDLVHQCEVSNIGLIFDTAHVAMMGDDVMGAFIEAYPYISLLQFADQPGRVEPGAGELDIVAVAAEAIRRGYEGLVDLEHGWVSPTREGESAGLERLRRFDAATRDAVVQTPS